ncbi:hypothetical protein VTK26DRAFT_6008 [Humicola hyalothermophila]
MGTAGLGGLQDDSALARMVRAQAPTGVSGVSGVRKRRKRQAIANSESEAWHAFRLCAANLGQARLTSAHTSSCTDPMLLP